MTPPELFIGVAWHPVADPVSEYVEWTCTFGCLLVRLCHYVGDDETVGSDTWSAEINGECLSALSDSPLSKSDALEDVLELSRDLLTEAAQEISLAQSHQVPHHLAPGTVPDKSAMQLIAEAASEFELTSLDVMSQSRSRNVVRARKSAARKLWLRGYSLKQIGSLLRRDYSTVHGLVHKADRLPSPKRRRKSA